MTDQKGPWEPRPAAPPPGPQPRRKPFQLGLWIGVIAAAGVGVLCLNRLLPGAIASGEGWSNVAYGLGLVAVVSAGLLRIRSVSLGRSARHLAIWAGLMAVLAVGYSYRNELGAVAIRVRSELAPGLEVKTAPHEMVVTQNDQGAFVLIGQVDGKTVRFVVDTGATDIVLSPADARRLGVDLAGLKFTRMVETANGPGRSAPFTAQSLAIGELRLSNVDMSINAAPMSSSLLGMSFLKQLDTFQVKDGRLYLRWRD